MSDHEEMPPEPNPSWDADASHPGTDAPTDAQVEAMVALLGDDPGPLQDAARRRLLSWGALAERGLKRGAERAHISTRTRCRALLRAIDVQRLLAQFGALRLDRSGAESARGLLEGAVMAAQMVRTFVPEARSLAQQLRRHASVLRGECAGRSLPLCARMLSERLHGRLGLRGCGVGDVDVEHVLIDRAWRNRIGAPVSLSLLYLLVARWAGLSAAGVAMPDHFLVRLHGPRPLLIDPFHGGRVVTKIDCTRYLRAHGHTRVVDRLRDLSDREVLIRYLQSLQKAAQPRPSSRPHSQAQATLRRALALLGSR